MITPIRTRREAYRLAIALETATGSRPIPYPVRAARQGKGTYALYTAPAISPFDIRTVQALLAKGHHARFITPALLATAQGALA